MTATTDVKTYAGYRLMTIVCMVILYAPLAVVTVNSPNASNSITVWEGLSRHCTPMFSQGQTAPNPRRLQAIRSRSQSLRPLWPQSSPRLPQQPLSGVVNTGCTPSPGLITLPIMVPEMVLAVATLIFFNSIGFPRGYLTILVARTAFCIPFACLPIQARMQGIENTYEHAAMDLYVTRAKAFRRILLPLMMPGIITGYLLAFVVSLDDFIITNFVKGAGIETSPAAVFGPVKQGLKPKHNGNLNDTFGSLNRHGNNLLLRPEAGQNKIKTGS